jgi:hypothetical protein
MSLDNTSQPSVKYCADKVNAKYIHGRPEPELVPSRYALRVGAIDVMVVSDGVLSLPGAMLGHNADPAVRAAWLDDMFLPPDVLEWALNVVVVRSGGRTILIDAGMGVEFPDLPRAGQWAQRLEAAGIEQQRTSRLSFRQPCFSQAVHERRETFRSVEREPISEIGDAQRRIELAQMAHRLPRFIHSAG